jgi:hypothetical protein
VGGGDATDFDVGHYFAVGDGGWVVEVVEFVGRAGAFDAFEAEDWGSSG